MKKKERERYPWTNPSVLLKMSDTSSITEAKTKADSEVTCLQQEQQQEQHNDNSTGTTMAESHLKDDSQGDSSKEKEMEMGKEKDKPESNKQQQQPLPTPTVTENPTPPPTKTGPYPPTPGAVPQPITKNKNLLSNVTQRPSLNVPSPVPGRVPLPTGPREKIPLAPGFSSLDWDNKMAEIRQNRDRANELIKQGLIKLTETEEELAIFAQLSEHNVPFLRRALEENIPVHMLRPRLKFNASLVRRHQVDEDQYWCVIHKKVYCISPYLKFHPGGKDAILDECEKAKNKKVDIGFAFDMQHHWVNYKQILELCYIGDFVRETVKR